MASVSVDLDSLHHYCRIHGVSETIAPTASENIIYRLAVPRFRELFAQLGIRATFFAIGEDLAHPEAASEIKVAAEAGHEIGNHSQSHDYALARRGKAEIAGELTLGAQSIERAVGVRPMGFRAPGYALSSALYQAVCEGGYTYDSSAFPAAPYYLAKALILGGLAITGRRSEAVLDRPSAILAPRQPYFPDPDNPYRRGAGKIIELPIATTRWGRFPFIGTVATLLPPSLSRVFYLGAKDAAFFNFELHGIDLIDQHDGIPQELVRRQRDLTTPFGSKIHRLQTVLGWIRQDYDVLPLCEAAVRVPG